MAWRAIAHRASDVVQFRAWAGLRTTTDIDASNEEQTLLQAPFKELERAAVELTAIELIQSLCEQCAVNACEICNCPIRESSQEPAPNKDHSHIARTQTMSPNDPKRSRGVGLLLGGRA